MPPTPFHLIPTTAVYFLLFRRLNGLAFFFGSLLIDLEPFIYWFLRVDFPQIPLMLGGFARQGLHMITHNPFSIVFLLAPAIVLLIKTVELTTRSFLLKIFSGAEWITYSWKQTYLSAFFGALLHLSWDLTMHYDINLGFPFIDILNPFVNYQAFSIILQTSLILILPAYFVGKRLNESSPFKKLP